MRSPQPTPKLEDTNFIGRTAAIAHLNTLVNQGSKVIVIQGEGGLGKTTLAQQYLQTQGFDLVLELLMAKETQNITPAERVVEEWLKQDFDRFVGTRGSRKAISASNLLSSKYRASSLGRESLSLFSFGIFLFRFA
ncbi:MAG: NB-ARC domain-containing protein [Nostoc sp.]